MKDETILNHDEAKDQYGAIVAPIYQNSLFRFKDWDSIDKAFDHKTEDYIYSRLMNPTVREAEDKIAAICRGEKAKLCGSGMAAISSAVLHCVKANGHIVTVKNVYGPSNNFFNKYLKQKFNIETSYVEGKKIEDFQNAIRPNTQLIYLESPASLTMELQDVQAVANLAKQKGIKTVIDNTWASPIFQKPLEMGIDIEVHSASKYLGGHSDLVAGVIVSSKQIVDQIISAEHELLGAKMAPIEGWLILRSLRTLPLRMKAMMETTIEIAQFLEAHDRVKKVHYPGLKSFDQYELGKRQMTGYGCLLSFELVTSNLDSIKAFVNALKLFSLGVSWGGHDSLVYAPVISYLKELPKERFEEMGISPSVIRLSIGLEHVTDLKNDLNDAFSAIK